VWSARRTRMPPRTRLESTCVPVDLEPRPDLAAAVDQLDRVVRPQDQDAAAQDPDAAAPLIDGRGCHGDEIADGAVRRRRNHVNAAGCIERAERTAWADFPRGSPVWREATTSANTARAPEGSGTRRTVASRDPRHGPDVASAPAHECHRRWPPAGPPSTRAARGRLWRDRRRWRHRNDVSTMAAVSTGYGVASCRLAAAIPAATPSSGTRSVPGSRAPAGGVTMAAAGAAAPGNSLCCGSTPHAETANQRPNRVSWAQRIVRCEKSPLARRDGFRFPYRWKFARPRRFPRNFG
jgi:hypothetical protein